MVQEKELPQSQCGTLFLLAMRTRIAMGRKRSRKQLHASGTLSLVHAFPGQVAVLRSEETCALPICAARSFCSRCARGLRWVANVPVNSCMRPVRSPSSTPFQVKLPCSDRKRRVLFRSVRHALFARDAHEDCDGSQTFP